MPAGRQAAGILTGVRKKTAVPKAAADTRTGTSIDRYAAVFIYTILKMNSKISFIAVISSNKTLSSIYMLEVIVYIKVKFSVIIYSYVFPLYLANILPQIEKIVSSNTLAIKYIITPSKHKTFV